MKNPITVAKLAREMAEELGLLQSTVLTRIEYAYRKGLIQHEIPAPRKTIVDRVEASHYLRNARWTTKHRKQW